MAVQCTILLCSTVALAMCPIAAGAQGQAGNPAPAVNNATPVAQQPSPPDNARAAGGDAAGRELAADAGTSAPAQSTTGTGEIIVTGSRAITSGYSAPTPVTVLSSQQLLATSPSVIEGLREVPQLAAGTTSSRTPSRITAAGNTTVGGVNLRNLGQGRTLVLLDGRRGPLSGASGITDVNLIPDFLVKRVDIVTGGASAAYGSDAVAGVVNFVLDTDFKGLKLDVNGGTSSRGDGRLYTVRAATGTGFADSRGHLVVSANIFHQDGVDGDQRDWSTAFWARIANPAAAQPGQPAFILRRGVSTSNASFGGLITAPAALRGTNFDAAGNPVAFDFGTDNNGSLAVTPDGGRFPFPVTAQTSSQSGFAHLDFEVTPNFKVFAEGIYGHSNTRYAWILNYLLASNAFTIFSDNAFLPQSVRNTMLAQNIASFTLGKVVNGDGPIVNYAHNYTGSGVAGFSWKPGGGWSVDGYYQHSANILRYGNENVSIRTHLYAAADAVVNPATNQIVCRVTLTNPTIEAAQGCVPINSFGVNALNAQQRAYEKGDMYARSAAIQDTAGFSVRGSPFAIWGGDVTIAAGAEYRRQSVFITVDPLSQTPINGTGIRGFPSTLQGQLLSFNLTNVPQPSGGAFSVKEAFGELFVPLARDVRGIKELSLNGAVRYTDYSTSGGVTTWKIGGTYAPFSLLRLRATRSRDIRAPNISELFGLATTSLQVVLDPARNNAATSNVRTLTGANPALTPEIADTTTVGAVVRSGSIGFSIDYYNIAIKSAISSLTGQQILNQCAAGQSSLCGLITRDSTGAVSSINAYLLNIQSVRTAGLDFETTYQGTIGNGAFSARGVATYLDHYTLINPVGAPIENVRNGSVNTGYNPRWIGSLSLDYKIGGWSFGVQERGIDSLTRSMTSTDDNDIPATFYTNLRIARQMTKIPGKPEIYLSIENLFDQDPRITETSGGAGALFYVTNPGLYDTLGRFFTLGVRARF